MAKRGRKSVKESEVNVSISMDSVAEPKENPEIPIADVVSAIENNSTNTSKVNEADTNTKDDIKPIENPKDGMRGVLEDVKNKCNTTSDENSVDDETDYTVYFIDKINEIIESLEENIDPKNKFEILFDTLFEDSKITEYFNELSAEENLPLEFIKLYIITELLRKCFKGYGLLEKMNISKIKFDNELYDKIVSYSVMDDVKYLEAMTSLIVDLSVSKSIKLIKEKTSNKSELKDITIIFNDVVLNSYFVKYLSRQSKQPRYRVEPLINKFMGELLDFIFNDVYNKKVERNKLSDEFGSPFLAFTNNALKTKLDSDVTANLFYYTTLDLYNKINAKK